MALTPDHAAHTNGGGHSANELHTLRAQLLEAGTAKGRLEHALAQARTDAADAHRQIHELSAERTSLATAYHGMQTELSRFQAEGSALRENLELARHRVSALEAHLESRERDLSQAHAAISTAAAETNSTREKLEQALAEGRRLGGELESTWATLRTLDEELATLRKHAAETDEELCVTGKELDEFIGYSETLEKENETLRHDLSASEKGRELLELRERIKIAETERVQAQRLREQAEADMKRLAESEQRQRADVESLLNRCKEAERRAESVSEPQLHHENEILRGIIERQKSEMERHFGELLRLRSARFGFRIAYLLFGASLAGLCVLVMKMAPRLLTMTGF